MKRSKRKLRLQGETIRGLTNSEGGRVNGGARVTSFELCETQGATNCLNWCATCAGAGQ